MEIHWIEVVVAAAVVYGLLKAEYYFRVWRYQRARRRLAPNLSVDESTKGFVDGASEAVACGRCGTMTNKFFEYADGDHWCQRCDEEGT